MTYPSIRDWLFSVKTFAASMLALYIGLAFQLPRPYWAMASVYIVSNPFVGATRSKALYRVLGTALGAAAAIALVPPFVETPLLFSVVVALWTGTLLYLAIRDRTARSYVFMLAGYTMPLVAFPTVTDPSTVFDVAIARTEEITVGIICASVIGSNILPSRLAPTLIERADAWFRDAAFYGRETLSGNIVGKAISACRQRLASTVNQLEFLLSQLGYDHTHPEILARAQNLRGRMQLFLPMISALADPLIALRRDLHVWPEGLDALLTDAAKWFDAPLPTRPADMHEDKGDSIADSLRARIAALQPAHDQLTGWEGALLSNALWRLGQVIDVWQDCLSLRALIAHEEGTWRPRYRHWRLGGTERFYDRGLMLISCAVPVGAILVACWLWVSSGWHDGASAVTLAAVACCFFAALDEPAPMVFRFFAATAASVVFAGLYLFVVLPKVHDFAMLVLIFAGPFILIGTLIPRPAFNMVTMLTAVNTATFISIQSAYDTDFLVFLNSNIAGVAGLLFAYVWTRVTRPFGAEFAARRLLRSSWADVALSASTAPLTDQRNLASRMVDRLMQLIPRLAASDEHRHPSIESFRDLRIALNALDLRRSRRKLDGDVPAAIDRVLAGVSDHYTRCAEANHRQNASPALLVTIDDAMHRVATRGLAQEAASAADTVTPGGTPRARLSQRGLRDTLHALVGLRLALYPALAGERPRGGTPEAGA
ncbi:putative membrane protein YccC [Paraburkholderia bannensis]|uniref:Putative membrane protein YccC n=1 Tax=Paraburkholderia bannensis TaxID=765414 RepID=A0A7W9TYF0_9BURK|nr:MULTISPECIES: FUSC family protein [Paraburkholderia]MBB3257477.1 putative membrane protein YccC [Paraburkholderia sp. WP4_3_2]MBB6102490.1 putative membrane protein YccC [Paraburkholderia bannensis]